MMLMGIRYSQAQGEGRAEALLSTAGSVKMAVFDLVWENNQCYRELYNVFRGLEGRGGNRLNCVRPESALFH